MCIYIYHITLRIYTCIHLAGPFETGNTITRKQFCQGSLSAKSTSCTVERRWPNLCKGNLFDFFANLAFRSFFPDFATLVATSHL